MDNKLSKAVAFVVAQDNSRHPLSSKLWNPDVVADAADLFGVDKHELVAALDLGETQADPVDLQSSHGPEAQGKEEVDVASDKAGKPISATELLDVLNGLSDPSEVVAAHLPDPVPAVTADVPQAQTEPQLEDELASLAAELGISLDIPIVIGGTTSETAMEIPKAKATRTGSKKGTRKKDAGSVDDGTGEVQPKPRKTRVKKSDAAGESQDQAPVSKPESKPADTSEPKKDKSATTRIKMDAPIPVVQFRGLVIGYYGNILEKLSEPDTEGYAWREIAKTKYSPLEYEQYRSKGRMLLIRCEEISRYLVGLEDADTLKFHGIIEVTNRGRGALRCRQLAQQLDVAYLEKRDEQFVSVEEYQTYLQTAPEPKLGLGA